MTSNIPNIYTVLKKLNRQPLVLREPLVVYFQVIRVSVNLEIVANGEWDDGRKVSEN